MQRLLAGIQKDHYFRGKKDTFESIQGVFLIAELTAYILQKPVYISFSFALVNYTESLQLKLTDRLGLFCFALCYVSVEKVKFMLGRDWKGWRKKGRLWFS